MAEALTEWSRQLLGVGGRGGIGQQQVLQASAEVAGIGHRILGTGGGILSDRDALDPHDHLNVFLVQAVVILSVCRGIGLFGHYLGQPKVIFEIVGGIILGPSAIGKNTYYLERIFPSSSLSHLALVAEIGLVLYLFLVGMELDVPKLADHAKKAGGVAIMGMAVPFGLGIAISHTVFTQLEASDPAYADVKPSSFFVFMGVALSITAFPVLARILKEGGLMYTKVGSLVMGAAALNDAVAWCLLILAISLANAGDLSIAGYVFLSVAAFAVGLYVIFRPFFERFVEYMESFNTKACRNHLFCLTLILVFLSAWTTALLGLDAIFGSFLFGLIIPRNSKLFHDCNEFIEELVLTFTLPLYFALSGLKTDITQIRSKEEIGMVFLIIFIATIGKFVGCGGCAYLSGMSFRESSAVAVLMNTRGLVELIVLNLGMQAGILNIRCFSVMVLMCLVTTFMTCPLLAWIYPPHFRDDIRATADPVEQNKINGNSSNDGGAITIDNVNSKFDITSKHRNLGLIVDRLEFLQYSIDLLGIFGAFKRGNTLAVTAVKLMQPSLSENDSLISYNSEGRLVTTEEEPTNFEEMNSMTFFALNKDSSKYVGKGSGRLMPLLFPLSLACNALGIPINAYDVKGSPSEFPLEVSHILSSRDCDFSIIPWRDSKYFETLFWDSLKAYTKPIAVYMCKGSFMYDFSDSQYVKTSSSSDYSTDSSSSATATATPALAQRKQSIIMKDYNPAPVDISLDSTGRISNILGIISGHDADSYVLSSVIRFLENPYVDVTLIIGSAFVNDPDFVAFLGIVDKARCRVKEVMAWDLDFLKSELSSKTYQLLIHSVIAPDIIRRGSVSQTNLEEKPKHHSIFDLSGAINQDPHGISEHRAALGVPTHLLRADIQFPELGVVGDFVLKQRKNIVSMENLNVLIFHSPLLHNGNHSSQTASSAHTSELVGVGGGGDLELASI